MASRGRIRVKPASTDRNPKVLWRKGRFKPGYKWRMLAWERKNGAKTELCSEDLALGAEFDELVIDHWLHIEQMSERHWWMEIGGYRLDVSIDGNGKPDVFIEQEQTPEEVAKCCEKVRVGK
jgi:hypothetical protein